MGCSEGRRKTPFNRHRLLLRSVRCGAFPGPCKSQDGDGLFFHIGVCVRCAGFVATEGFGGHSNPAVQRVLDCRGRADCPVHNTQNHPGKNTEIKTR